MNYRYIISLIALIALSQGLSAQRKRPGKHKPISAVEEKMELLKNPDKNHNVKIDATELRNWSKLVIKLYNDHRREARKLGIDLEFVNKFDLDKDEHVDLKESHKFQTEMKDFFEEAYEKIIEEFDENDTGRLESKENKAFYKDIGEKYMEHVLEIMDIQDVKPADGDKEKPRRDKRDNREDKRDNNEEEEVEEKKKKALDDIYD